VARERAKKRAETSRVRVSSAVPALSAVIGRLDLPWSDDDEHRCLRQAQTPSLASAVSDPTYGGTVDPLPLTDARVSAAVELLAERCELDARLLLPRLTDGRVAAGGRQRSSMTDVEDWRALLRVWSALPAWRGEDFASWWAERLGSRLPEATRRGQRHSTAANNARDYVAVMFAAAGD
jgi:hypothetical protein